GSLLKEIVGLLERGAIAPVPHRTYSVANVGDAFREMARGKHTGKIVITVHGERVSLVPAADETSDPVWDGSYLITGGLGALGLEVARWLVDQGARSVALVGRNAASADARRAIEAMERRGARIMVMQADVASESDLKAVFARIAEAGPPLKGVVH